MKESKYDPKYCPQCYQYDANADGLPEACKICFGENHNNSETSFEAAFIVLADIEGTTSEDSARFNNHEHQATDVLYIGDDRPLHADQSY